MRFFAFWTVVFWSCAACATADVLFEGDTTDSLTWNTPSSLTSLSSIGTATPYFVQPFYTTTDQSGVVLEIDGITHPDTLALIYAGSFDPGNPLNNLVDGSDDFSGLFSVLPGTGQGFASSRIAPGETSNFTGGAGITLMAHTQYYALVTGYSDGDFGSFDAGIGGVDLVLGLIAIPEPSAALALGLASVFGIFYRRWYRGNPARITRTRTQ